MEEPEWQYAMSLKQRCTAGDEKNWRTMRIGSDNDDETEDENNDATEGQEISMLEEAGELDGNRV